MAAASVTRTQILCNDPYLIKKYTVTSGTSGVAVTHGETSSPSFVIMTMVGADPTGSEGSAVATSATITTLDFEADSKSYEVYMVWLNQASGGIS
jgi:hypothetical protein